jgi:hypothetical protein
MDTLLFILLLGVAVVGIVMAIDIQTTRWERFKPVRKKPLWQILYESDTTVTDHEAITPAARTYTEALRKAQERGRQTS